MMGKEDWYIETAGFRLLLRCIRRRFKEYLGESVSAQNTNLPGWRLVSSQPNHTPCKISICSTPFHLQVCINIKICKYPYHSLYHTLLFVSFFYSIRTT